MNKYLTLFTLSWQRQLEVRTDFIFEQGRSLAVLVSLYYLWSALLTNRTDVAGYNREQMLTYVLMMTLLRGWVLSCATDRIPSEISRGKLSELLLRPISHLGYWATQDAAAKAINVIAAVAMLSVFVWWVRPPFLVPETLSTWAMFVATTLGGMVLYFQMSYMLGVMGFWTAQSWGPRFLFEIVLEFCAGAYFPIDLLPAGLQRGIGYLPFPYLIFHPLSIYLGRTAPADQLAVLGHQVAWMAVLALLSTGLWRLGLRRYAAEGG